MFGALRLAAAAPRRSARLTTYASTGGWNAHFDQLAPERAQHGDSVVPTKFVAADGNKLGSWTSTQRLARKAGKLSAERIERLESVGFVWDTPATDWNAHFDQLAAYRAAEGHSVVPTKFVTADGNKLGSWVSMQQLARKEGKLSPERIERLEAVGFLLQDYRAEHGHCDVPVRFVAADGIMLGYWVQQQRRIYKTGELSPERFLRLKAVGFVWNPLASMWDANFEALTAYLAAHGNCAVPQTFAAADGTNLGAWVSRLRQAYKAGELSPERIERLEAVVFVWRVPFRSATLGWDKTFELLQAYCEANGHCAVPDTFVAADGTKLGQWVAWQRSVHKAGKLSAERVERLEAVEFVWRSPVGLAAAWDAHFELLAAYHAAHGNCVMPSNFVAADGTKLGSWVDRQRTAHHTGKLSAERVERLKAVAFVWKVRVDGWDAHFELLGAYHAAHGDCALPYLFVAADGTKLGWWVSTQRRAHKADGLSPERAERLEAFGLVWTVFAGWGAQFELLQAFHAAHGTCL
ncbi:helicase associated domain-containing protein, partial [Pelagophyceae sp. CCMP2097]